MSSREKTIADVFIIETLDPDDEGNGRFEGVFLSHILKLHNKQPIYRYVRTREQFLEAIKEFGESCYRYLHLSCHGDPEGLITTNQDEIDFDELALELNPHLDSKRLFISACEMVHLDLANAVITDSGCFSVVGPTEKIAFTDSAIIWAAIYHLVFSQDSKSINRNNLRSSIKGASKLFEVDFSYFSKNKNGIQDLLKS